jgi:hypothetical protein
MKIRLHEAKKRRCDREMKTWRLLLLTEHQSDAVRKLELAGYVREIGDKDSCLVLRASRGETA